MRSHHFRPTDDDYLTVPKVIRTPFVDETDARSAEGRHDVDDLREQLYAAFGEGRLRDLAPWLVTLVNDWLRSSYSLASLYRFRKPAR